MSARDFKIIFVQKSILFVSLYHTQYVIKLESNKEKGRSFHYLGKFKSTFSKSFTNLTWSEDFSPCTETLKSLLRSYSSNIKVASENIAIHRPAKGHLVLPFLFDPLCPCYPTHNDLSRLLALCQTPYQDFYSFLETKCVGNLQTMVSSK
mmetsp:Transcript_14269/g.18017  ORF Transcript_14269/g.18017 Transcript_14269/m.18017 type:complete len:150 (+) Transcript_14269:58-507(+)